MTRIFQCCSNSNPRWLITYRVAEDVKTYSVCETCFELDYFRKHIVKKEEFEPNSICNTRM